jgi:hypothetical protein
MAQEESKEGKGEVKKFQVSPSLARRLHRTKAAVPLVKDDSTDEISCTYRSLSFFKIFAFYFYSSYLVIHL